MEGEWRIMAANEIVAKVQKRITDLEQGNNGLKLPSDYSLGNALNAAWLMIAQDTKLMATTDESKAQTLLNMSIQGLSPAKQQGYFIPYDNKLTFQRSYFGGLTILQRLDNVKGKPFAEVVHQDDEFEIGADGFGRTIVSKFEPKFENQDKPIIGAFALITTTNDEQVYTIMTKKMINQSWSHTKMKTNKVQSEFPEEMAKRTVLNRAAKMFINTSGDNDMLIKAVNETTANEFDNERTVVNETPKDSVAELFENEFKEHDHVDAIGEGETNASNGEEPEDAGTGEKQGQLL